MLILSRKVGETVYIDGRIRVTVIHLGGSRAKIGIEAPDDIPIVRSELRCADSDNTQTSQDHRRVDAVHCPVWE